MNFDRLGKSFFLFGIFSFVAILLLCGSYFRRLDFYEHDTLDLRFRLRPEIPRTQQAVIIEIGNDTITQLAHFPLNRSYHAVLIKALADAGAKAIVFDIFFSEPHASDDEFADAIKNAGNVYLPHVLELKPTPEKNTVVAERFSAESLPNLTKNTKGTGHINIIPDSDGKFRRVPLYIKHAQSFYPYLSFLVVSDVSGISAENIKLVPGKYIRYGKDIKIPLDEHSRMIINFSGKWAKSYAHYSYADVLRSYMSRFSGETPVLDLSLFKDKICFIGLTAEGTADLHPNPFEPLYPSVGIHAEVVNSIVNKAFITRVSKCTNLIVLILLLILTALIVGRFRPLRALGVVLGMIIVYAATAVLLFNGAGLWIDFFYPMVAILFIYVFVALWKSVIEWKNRLLFENELKIARQIQESFLPKELPVTGKIDVAARMLTARAVGGDLYDCFTFETSLGVMIGDVAGKGIPASLYMSLVVGLFKFYAVSTMTPQDTLLQLNEKLIKEVKQELSLLFVSMFYAVFDFQKNIMIYANGGHLPVLYLPRQGTSQFLDVEEGFVLGKIKGPYTGRQVSFSTGDLFVFYTDGITESRNTKEDMYGIERLQKLIEHHRDQSVNELIKMIEEDVRRFEPQHRQHDDITYVILKVL